MKIDGYARVWMVLPGKNLDADTFAEAQGADEMLCLGLKYHFVGVPILCYFLYKAMIDQVISCLQVFDMDGLRLHKIDGYDRIWSDMN